MYPYAGLTSPHETSLFVLLYHDVSLQCLQPWSSVKLSQREPSFPCWNPPLRCGISRRSASTAGLAFSSALRSARRTPTGEGTGGRRVEGTPDPRSEPMSPRPHRAPPPG